jgi:hypothetical protein
MHEFKDPSRLTRVAVICLWIYLACDTAFGLATLFSYVTNPDPDPLELGIADLIGLADFVTVIVCFVVVGCWIYRVSANAHVISDDMTISPGWAVGWYFVPFANLVKPYQGMKEAWMASHFRDNWHGEPTPALLGWWWGLWLVTSIMSNISFRISMNFPGEALGAVVFLDVVATALNIPLCLILITMMQRLCRAQLYAWHDETFA